MSRQTCPKCGDRFKSVGHHWRYNPEHRPNIDEYQMDILTGLVMGDGTVNHRHKDKSHICCEMINLDYLEYIDNIFGPLSQGVKLKHTAKERAKLNRESGFSENALEENYNDTYYWSCSAHPKINKFDSWYSEGYKIWPEEIRLTPTVLKHWYVCDGSLDVQGGYSSIIIGLSNECENKNKINKMFSKVNLPTPSWVDYVDNEGYRNCTIRFSSDETDELLSYMGKPVPGFSYKWGK